MLSQKPRVKLTPWQVSGCELPAKEKPPPAPSCEVPAAEKPSVLACKISAAE